MTDQQNQDQQNQDQQNQDQQNQDQFINTIPEEYREKPWAKENAKDPNSFFKFVDNQNTLVGKKGIVIPEPDAPIEAKNEFFKALGRPDDPEGYEFEPLEELKDKERDPEFDKAVKNILHQAGVPKNMAKQLQQGFDKIVYEKAQEQIAQSKQEDEAFDKFNKEYFGDDKDKIVANAQKILKDVVRKEALPALDKMSAEQLALVVAVTDGVFKKFGNEDGYKGSTGGAAAASGESYEELSAKQRELMSKPGYDDWRHPDHASLMEQNKVLMEKMRKIKN